MDSFLMLFSNRLELAYIQVALSIKSQFQALKYDKLTTARSVNILEIMLFSKHLKIVEYIQFTLPI